MGAAGSAPRTLTMKNDQPHIIELTSDVINRIAHGYQLPQAPQQELGTSSSEAYIAEEIQRPTKEGGEERERVALSVGAGGHEILETVSALQVRKEKDEELKANDLFWKSKLKELEGRYVTSAFTSEQEFNSQLEQLQRLMPKRREVICDEISPQVANCYAANPKQVLKCSDLVQQFTRCVEQKMGKTLPA